MATVDVKCPYCESSEVMRYGKSRTNVQRYKCKHCSKLFQLDYFSLTIKIKPVNLALISRSLV